MLSQNLVQYAYGKPIQNMLMKPIPYYGKSNGE